MNWWDIAKETLTRTGKCEERILQKQAVERLQELFESFTSRSSNVPPILIRLPCGYGKTIIGEAPFIAQLKTGNWLTRGACYVLPTRALTKHHVDVIQKHVNLVDSNVNVSAFHGEEHTTNVFYADVAVSTFDIFTYAYARSSRTGHHLEFPAGTIATSYVVFDEAHMLQDEYAYTHSIMNKLLRVLSASGVPTIVMTATMPKPIQDVIFDGLEPLQIPDFTNHVGIRQTGVLLKSETYRGIVSEVELSEKTPLKEIDESAFVKEIPHNRVLIVCNTVRTAQILFDKIRKELKKLNISGEVILLHSRLGKRERMRRETLARTLMSRTKCAGKCEKGEESCIPFPLYLRSTIGEEFEIFCEECVPQKQGSRRLEYVVIIATQVVEAGLDITSDILITECAPPDSLIQRVGRCARFPGEKGLTKIFYHEDVWRPYPKDLIEETWRILKGISRQELSLALTDFPESMSLVNKGYKVLQRGIPYEKLRWYLSYLEGSGFSTFTIDWQALRTIQARPNVSLTVVVPVGEMPLYEAQEERALIDPRKSGKFRHYKTLSTEMRLSYSNLLQRLVNLRKQNKYLLLECGYADEHSFSLDLHYAAENGKPRHFLVHQANLEGQLVVLNLVRASTIERGIEYLYLLSLSKSPISEGMYLLNPEFYDSTLGLKIGDKK